MKKKTIIVILVIVIHVLLFIRDVYNDRQHKILIKNKTPVYVN
jgi:hypothetical protein